MLKDIVNKYATDKGSNHSYIEMYDTLFSKYQHQPIKFLEIGILNGDSLLMFNEYFDHPLKEVHGMDSFIQATGFDGQHIDSNLVKNKLCNHNIKVHECNSLNADDVNTSVAKHALFSIIIDDGDHQSSSQYTTFVNMFPYLKQNGMYVIEDVSSGEINDLANKISSSCGNMNIQGYIFRKNDRHDDCIIVITRIQSKIL